MTLLEKKKKFSNSNLELKLGLITLAVKRRFLTSQGDLRCKFHQHFSRDFFLRGHSKNTC